MAYDDKVFSMLKTHLSQVNTQIYNMKDLLFDIYRIITNELETPFTLDGSIKKEQNPIKLHSGREFNVDVYGIKFIGAYETIIVEWHQTYVDIYVNELGYTPSRDICPGFCHVRFQINYVYGTNPVLKTFDLNSDNDTALKLCLQLRKYISSYGGNIVLNNINIL